MSSATPPTSSSDPSAGRSAMRPPAVETTYRPISTMAVVVFLASLVALASFFNLYLIPIAIVILIVSIVVSVRLDRARLEYAGQLLAKLAILVSMVAVFGAATTHGVTFLALSSEARAFSESYLRALLADDLEEAFRMRIGPQARAYCRNDLKEMLMVYNKNFEGFKKEGVTKALRAGGQKSTVTYLGATEIEQMDGLNLIGVQYRVQLDSQPPRTYDVALAVHGGVSQAGDWEGRQWYIWGNDGIKETPKP